MRDFTAMINGLVIKKVSIETENYEKVLATSNTNRGKDWKGSLIRDVKRPI